MTAESVVDDDLGPVRYCPRCREWWPDDGDFWSDAPVCIACAAEQREERLARQRPRRAAAMRRYRAARRVTS